MESSNNVNSTNLVAQQLAAQLSTQGAKIATAAKGEVSSLLSLIQSSKGQDVKVGSSDVTNNPLALQAPKAGQMGGFSGQSVHLNAIQLIALMMVTYEKSQTEAATSNMQVGNNLSDQFTAQLGSLLTSAEETQSINDDIEQQESRESWTRYAMQAVMLVAATSIGFMIGGPVGAVVAASVCIFNDVMTDTGGWDDVCTDVDNALGVTGKAADAVNFVIKIGTSLTVGLLSGGVAGIGMVAEDAIASTLAEAGEEFTAKGAVKVVGNALTSVFTSTTKSLTKSTAGTLAEDGIEMVDMSGKGAGKQVADDLIDDLDSIGEDSGSALDSAEGSMKDAEKGLNAVDNESELAKGGEKQIDDVRDRKADKESNKDVKGEASGKGEPTTGKRPKIGKRAAIMTIHTAIQTGTEFKTADGTNGQEMGAVGDLVLACGGSQDLATALNLAANGIAMIGDLVASFKVAADVPTVGMKIAAGFMKGVTLVSTATEAALSGINGYQQLRLSGELYKLSSVAAETILESGAVQTTMMMERQNSDALSNLMSTEEDWAGLVENMLQTAFGPVEMMLQA
jgi:hypothetical protein